MNRLITIGIVGLSFATAGCGKSSAESAIKKAESGLAAIKADAEQVAPDELRALTDSIAAMKALVASGDHSGALMGARQAGTKTRDLAANLVTRRGQLNSAFAAMSTEVPKMLESVTAKVAELSALKKLPPTVDAAKFAAIKGQAAGWATNWAAAADSFKAGNLAAAMSAATAIKAELTTAMATLGLS